MNTFIDIALSAFVDEELNDEIKADLTKHYQEPWRHYHTFEHIKAMFILLDKEYVTKLNKRDLMKIRLAILFHDVIYLPWNDSNEVESAYYFLSTFKKYTGQHTIEEPLTLDEAHEVRDAIFFSKWGDSNHKLKWQRYFIQIDHAILADADVSNLLTYEKKIYKEFQFVPHNLYRESRINFLLGAIKVYGYDHLNVLLPKTINSPDKVKVGLYYGSFDPFHKGHFNILEQAEKIFDKVIIVVNGTFKSEEEKLARMAFIFRSAPGREVVHHTDSLIDFIDNRPEDIFLIRGLVDTPETEKESDIYDEIENTTRGQNIKTVYLKCDISYSFLSSERVKELLKSSTESPNNYLTCDSTIQITSALLDLWKKESPISQI